MDTPVARQGESAQRNDEGAPESDASIGDKRLGWKRICSSYQNCQAPR